MRSIEISQQFKRHCVPVFVSLALFALGVLSGILLQKYYSVGQWLKAIGVRDKRFANSPVQRPEVPISGVRSGRVMVALVFGQSNAANSGETPYESRQGVYNFHKGKLYPPQDPLLGATGDGGSVWTRLGNKLIEKTYYDAVVFVPLGVGATEIARWKPDGDLHPAILQAIDDVGAQGLTLTHLLWHQGESDALLKTSKNAYQRMFLAMLSSIRKQGVDAPIYVSVATRCGKQRPDEQIRQAQQELVNPAQGIYGGPDTDTLGFCDRYDGCHFSDAWLEKFAQLWLEKLNPEWPPALPACCGKCAQRAQAYHKPSRHKALESVGSCRTFPSMGPFIWQIVMGQLKVRDVYLRAGHRYYRLLTAVPWNSIAPMSQVPTRFSPS